MCKSKLNPGGVLVTQSGQAGIKQHPVVFTSIHNTLKQVFPRVFPMNQAVYSFMDEWGWNLAVQEESASNNPQNLTKEEVDKRIASRINGELKFLDGESWRGVFALSKLHRRNLAAETAVPPAAQKVRSF